MKPLITFFLLFSFASCGNAQNNRAVFVDSLREIVDQSDSWSMRENGDSIHLTFASKFSISSWETPGARDSRINRQKKKWDTITVVLRLEEGWSDSLFDTHKKANEKPLMELLTRYADSCDHIGLHPFTRAGEPYSYSVPYSYLLKNYSNSSNFQSLTPLPNYQFYDLGIFFDVDFDFIVYDIHEKNVRREYSIIREYLRNNYPSGRFYRSYEYLPRYN